MLDWLVAYLLTCAVEIPLVVALVRRLGWAPGSARPLAETVALAWALQLTHPLLWLVGTPDVARLVAAEVSVTVVEVTALAAWVIGRCGADRSRTTWGRAMLVAVVANGSSLALGLLLRLLLA